MIMKLDTPMLLKENRVWRIYQGGRCIDELRRKTSLADGFFPEDWVGSVTHAVNRGREHLKNEGLSTIVLREGNSAYDMVFADLLKDKTVALDFFGEKHVAAFGPSPEILVKLLDSKIRLPLQTHPDRDFAKKHLNAKYGKTECWIVLGGREIDNEKPHVYFGFKDNVTKNDFDSWFKAQDVSAMLNALNKIYVTPGDVFSIPANIIHAVGPGVFLAEIQEPSDLVFHFDRKGPCWDLDDHQTHMNLGGQRMLDTLDYSIQGKNILETYQTRFDPTAAREGVQKVLPGFMSSYFNCNYVTAYNLPRDASSFMMCIVYQGAGKIVSKGDTLVVHQGDTFLVPFSAVSVRYESDSTVSPLRIVEALPPEIPQ